MDGFLLQPGLLFAEVMTSDKIERIFRKHGGLFGEHGIFSTPIVLWAFVGPGFGIASKRRAERPSLASS